MVRILDRILAIAFSAALLTGMVMLVSCSPDEQTAAPITETVYVDGFPVCNTFEAEEGRSLESAGGIQSVAASLVEVLAYRNEKYSGSTNSASEKPYKGSSSDGQRMMQLNVLLDRELGSDDWEALDWVTAITVNDMVCISGGEFLLNTIGETIFAYEQVVN